MNLKKLKKKCVKKLKKEYRIVRNDLSLSDVRKRAIPVAEQLISLSEGKEKAWKDEQVKQQLEELFSLCKENYMLLCDPKFMPYLEKLFLDTWEMEKQVDDAEMKQVVERFISFENETIRKRLMKYYLKGQLPRIYAEAAKKPMEKKTVFLQPTRRLNDSCKLIFRRLKEETEYEPHLHELLRNQVPRCCHFFLAKRFIEDVATCKAVFIHESNNIMSHIKFREGQKVIQLWHGCGVLKKIGLDTYGREHYKSMKSYLEYPEYNYFSMVTIASPALTDLFSRFMGIDKESGVIQPIGVSRTDVFFDEEYIKDSFDSLHRIVPQSVGKKVILYAPTYRGLTPHRYTPDCLDIGAFYEAFSKDYILVFKHHQTVKQLPEIPEEYKDFAFNLTHVDGLDINKLMTVADVCISDYSSVVYEYSLFEKPLLYYVYDYDEYTSDRGIYLEYLEDTPGPKCRTNEEMIDYIKNLDTKFNKQEITDFRNKYMSACDGHATDRIMAYALS